MPALDATDRALVDFIEQHSKTRGFPPTLRECADALGFSSVRSAEVRINRLAERGIVSRSRSPRSLVVVPPSERVLLQLAAAAELTARVIETAPPTPDTFVWGGFESYPLGRETYDVLAALETEGLAARRSVTNHVLRGGGTTTVTEIFTPTAAGLQRRDCADRSRGMTIVGDQRRALDHVVMVLSKLDEGASYQTHEHVRTPEGREYAQRLLVEPQEVAILRRAERNGHARSFVARDELGRPSGDVRVSLFWCLTESGRAFLDAHRGEEVGDE